MQKTKIEYLTHVWNPLAMRCTPVSEGCANCWHLAMADRLAVNPTIPEDRRLAYTGFRPVLIEKEINAPLKLKKPAIIGVQFMGDLFHEDVTEEAFLNILNVIRESIYEGGGAGHTFLILTKRPNTMKLFFEHLRWNGSRLVIGNKGTTFLQLSGKSVWLGVTAENQKRADERIPILLQIPAAKRFVSIEPMLSEINLEMALEDFQPLNPDFSKKPSPIQWVIVGGESGTGARPMHHDWARSVRDQCVSAEVPFFFKQWGEWSPALQTNALFRMDKAKCFNFRDTLPSFRVGKKIAGRLLDGREWGEMP